MAGVRESMAGDRQSMAGDKAHSSAMIQQPKDYHTNN